MYEDATLVRGCVTSAASREAPGLHVIRERDAGLFSLIQQVIANIPWARKEGRIPIVDFGERTSYWTPRGYRGKDNVWEYYFEPIVPGYPATEVPERVRKTVAHRFPSQSRVGFFADERTFVTNHYGDHPSLVGKALAIPYLTGNPDPALRREAAEIIRECVRPRSYIRDKEQEFFEAQMRGEMVIGVHVRGTDAVSTAEVRTYRRGSLNLPRFATALERLVRKEPEARILVASDAETSLSYLRGAFGSRVIAYDAVRHENGEPAGTGPTGAIMPAYIATDRDRAARNGEEAIVEYLLLARCTHLVHNGASLATTVLLQQPDLAHTNTHVRE